jgi:hypothetical protein
MLVYCGRRLAVGLLGYYCGLVSVITCGVGVHVGAPNLSGYGINYWGFTDARTSGTFKFWGLATGRRWRSLGLGPLLLVEWVSPE